MPNTNIELEKLKLESNSKKIIWSHHVFSFVVIISLIIMLIIGFDGGLKNKNPKYLVSFRESMIGLIEENQF